MKKIKNFLCIAVAAIVSLAVGLFAAACGGTPDEPPVVPTYYSVTVEADAAKGTVTLSPAAAGDGKYVAGETVLVTVTPVEGYKIGSVKANGAALTPADGKYTFTVAGDTVVKAEFDEDADPSESGYTVTVGDYDKTKGAISVSAPEAGKKYDLHELVTVTVTPASGYETGAIIINGEVRERSSNTFEFMVVGNAVISAAFFADTSAQPEVTGLGGDGTFRLLFRGHWKSDSGKTLIIGEKRLNYDGNVIGEVSPKNSDNEQVYSFMLNGTEYQISWADTVYAVGSAIAVLDMGNPDNYTNEYFIPDPLSKFDMDDTYIGDWEEDEGDGTLKVEPDGITLDGVKTADIVDLGYYDATDDILQSPIGAHLYFFVMSGRKYLMIWEPESGTVFLNGVPYISPESKTDEPYVFSPAFIGGWTGADGARRLEITENSLSLDNNVITVRGETAEEFELTFGGADYIAELLPGSDYVLRFIAYTYDDGLISGAEYLYFIKDNRPAAEVNGALLGNWTEKDASGAPDEHTLGFSADGIKLDGADVTLIEEGEQRENGYSYVVLSEGKIYFITYEANAGEEPQITLEGDYTTVFEKAS